MDTTIINKYNPLTVIVGLVLLLCLLNYLFSATTTSTAPQLGGQDVVSSTTVTDDEVNQADIEAAVSAETETTVYDVNQGDLRNADYTDANLSRTDVNTIANGPGYVGLEQQNMYYTGQEVDGIGNYTVDGAAQVQGQRPPRRIDPRLPIRPPFRPPIIGSRPRPRLGPVIEANPWSMRNYRPRSNDRLLRIQRAGLRQVDVIRVFDWMGRSSFVFRLKGFLPTGCNQLRILPVRLDALGNIRFVVYSVVDPLLLCTQAVSQFDVTIPLVQLPPRPYNVVVNNRTIATIR
jgi:hypothetical protein